jgi:membrane fusion protein (multidrug efflux system)
MKGIYPLLVIVPAGLTVLLSGCGPKQAAPPPGPPEVLVTEATQADVPIFSEAIATLDGSTNTQIHSQVTGFLVKQAYVEGSVVKAGDLLFQIDPKPFQADLDKAQASLANQQAQYQRTKQDLDRYAALVKSGAVSQQEYQGELQNNLSAQANVNAAQASVDTAKINLGYTQITSPIIGIAGKANSQIGDLINPNTTLTTVSTVDPIQADFTLPEQFYLNNAERFAKATEVPLADRPDAIELILADGTVYPHRGKFYYLNRQIQTSTGAITAYALFPNPDRMLRPGQYAKVRGVTERINNAVLVPQRSVNELQGIDQVYVVGADNKVEVRNVTLGDKAGSLQIVTAGLNAGERVVVEGIQKCAAGGEVNPQPYPEPPPVLPTSTLPALPHN